MDINRDIIYGGAFNPPTIAHASIILYLRNKFPDQKIILLPTNDFYDKTHIGTYESYEHRKIMIEISNYEYTLDSYKGTYYTLKHFNHPYFVLGADALLTISFWIMYPKIIEENYYIVFPRMGYDINKIIEENEILKKYQSHFIIINDYKINDISSTKFRQNFTKELLYPQVYQYILDNKLYKMKGRK